MRRRKRGRPLLVIILEIIFFPLFLVDGALKVVTKMARPQNGRYGTRSINKRRKKW